MLKKPVCLVILISLATPIFAFRLAVSGFSVSGHESPEMVESILVNSLVAKLAGIPGLEILDRTKLDSVLEEQNLALSGLVDSNTVMGIGGLLGSMAVLTGDCIFEGDEVFISSMIIDSETGLVLHARAAAFSGTLFSAIEYETTSLASEISVDEEDNLRGKPAALWVSQPEGQRNAGISKTILIYAMSNVEDSKDLYGQWYLGPDQLIPVTESLREEGYTVQVHDRRTLPNLAAADLGKFGQVWLLEADSNGFVDPTEEDIRALEDYAKQGGGVWLSGENVPDERVNNWTEDINAFAEPFGFRIADNVVSYSITLPVPDSDHPLLKNVDTLLFDGETGSIDVFENSINILVPIEEESRILDPSITYEDLYQWADPERIQIVTDSDGAYSFGWLLARNFKKAGPKVSPDTPGIIFKDSAQPNGEGRLIADSGWLLGWSFTDSDWDEYRQADNIRFLLNSAAWLASGR